MPELLDKFLIAVHDAHTAFDVRLRRIAAPALTRPLESRTARDTDHLRCTWNTSLSDETNCHAQKLKKARKYRNFTAAARVIIE